MGRLEAQNPEVLAHYEGLIFKTAELVAPYVEDDIEDVRQVLRIKVWRALVRYEARAPEAPDERGRTPRDRFVFSCVRNQAKDLFKKRRQNTVAIEALVADQTDARSGLRSRDSFESKYLSSTAEEVYGAVEDDDVLVPSTLTLLERRIVVLLYREHRQVEAARALGLDKREMERAMKSIRAKMADWRPSTEAQDPVALAA